MIKKKKKKKTSYKIQSKNRREGCNIDTPNTYLYMTIIKLKVAYRKSIHKAIKA